MGAWGGGGFPMEKVKMFGVFFMFNKGLFFAGGVVFWERWEG